MPPTSPPSSDALYLKSLVDWWTDMGALADLSGHVANSATGAAASDKPKEAMVAATKKRPPPAPKRAAEDPVGDAKRVASAADSLAALKSAVEAFDGCDLKLSARNTVFADGQPDAEIMIVGEAPGRDEDAVGLPFVGRSGQLLDRMFAAIGLSRASNLYITNILPWRPPGNRNPEPDEVSICLPFVERQIELIKPKLLITAGKFAAHSLLKTSEGVMRLRGKRRTYMHDGLTSPIPCLPILHPAYLLRRPPDKSRAWSDMLTIETMAEELGAKRDLRI